MDTNAQDLYGHCRDTGGTWSKFTFKYNVASNGKRITTRGFLGLIKLITRFDFIETSDLDNEVAESCSTKQAGDKCFIN